MYKTKNTFDDDYFEKGMTIPANTNADGVNELFADKTLGSLEVIGRVKTAITLTGNLVVDYMHADAAGGSYTSLHVATIATADIGDPDTHFERYVIPSSAKNWIKINIATTDVGALGTLDFFLNYLAK